jgi:hypothetical protein
MLEKVTMLFDGWYRHEVVKGGVGEFASVKPLRY